ncbi:MAG: DUF2188 domain-containing protein [Candidatus Marinimicrobia bacterium]|nr:DUF2188 domain-containing protein [Candidatus Neomarinimicrobiota bacterium]
MPRISYHVVKNPRGGWSVIIGGTYKASKVFRRKEDAEAYAMDISKNKGTDLVIHGKDGRIQRTASHSKESPTPREQLAHKI